MEREYNKAGGAAQKWAGGYNLCTRDGTGQNQPKKEGEIIHQMFVEILDIINCAANLTMVGFVVGQELRDRYRLKKEKKREGTKKEPPFLTLTLFSPIRKLYLLTRSIIIRNFVTSNSSDVLN